MQLPQVWTPAAFSIPQRDWSGQPSNIHDCLGMQSAVWCFFFCKTLLFQSLKSGRKGSPGRLSILPLPGSIFYPFCPSFLDNFFHRIRKDKMDQLSVFDKEALKFFVLLLPIPLSLGLWEKWISRCRRHWMDIYPPLYMNVYYYLYIYFSMLCRRFFRDGVWKVPRMALIKKTQVVYYKE